MYVLPRCIYIYIYKDSSVYVLWLMCWTVRLQSRYLFIFELISFERYKPPCSPAMG